MVGVELTQCIWLCQQSVVEFRSVDDLLLVPGIGRSLIEQNRGLLVCSIPGGAPYTRNTASRRSLRRTSLDIRHREVGKSEETNPEAQGDSANCASSQVLKPTRINLRDQSHSSTVDQLHTAEHSSTSCSASCKSDLRPKEEVRKQCSEERREDEGDKRKEKVTLRVPEEHRSDCCECFLGEDEEGEEKEGEGASIDGIPVMENNEQGDEEEEEENGDIVEEAIMSIDDLVNTAPEMKISTGEVFHSVGCGRNERSCNSGLMGGCLGTDTPHEDAPADLPLDIPTLFSHQLTDGDNSSEEEVDGGDVEEEEDEEDEEEGHMEEDGVEDSIDDCMTVDPPTSPYTDKKQVSSVYRYLSLQCICLSTVSV